MYTVKLVDSEELVAGLPINATWAYTANIDVKNGTNAFHGGPPRRVLHISSGLYLQPRARSMGEAVAIVRHVESLPIDWASPIDELIKACQANAVDWDAVMRGIRPPMPKRSEIPALEYLLSTPEWRDAKVIGDEIRPIGRLVEVRSTIGRRRTHKWEYADKPCYIVEHPSGARAVVCKEASAEELAGRFS